MKTVEFMEYRRWAESLKEEAKKNSSTRTGAARQSAVDEYWYLSEWCTKFDRVAQCLNWNEEHTVYIDGVKRLQNLCTSL